MNIIVYLIAWAAFSTMFALELNYINKHYPELDKNFHMSDGLFRINVAILSGIVWPVTFPACILMIFAYQIGLIFADWERKIVDVIKKWFDKK